MTNNPTEQSAEDLKTCNEAFKTLSDYCNWQKSERTKQKELINQLQEECETMTNYLKYLKLGTGFKLFKDSFKSPTK